MKDASKYEKKIKTLLKGAKKIRPDLPPNKDDQAVAVLIKSVLESEATPAQAHAAFKTLQDEFVDFNELRASPPKDLVDCFGKDFPQAKAKALALTTTLNNIFERTYRISLDYMTEMTKRDLRRHLMELGLDLYAAASVLLRVFASHAIPVDQNLVDVLKMGQNIHPDSDPQDTQGFLERVILQKNALTAHEFFRSHITKHASVLARKRKAEAEARAKAEAEAKARAEAKAKKTKKAAAKKSKATAKAKTKKKKCGKKKVAKKKTSKKAPAGKSTKAAKKTSGKVTKKTQRILSKK